VLDEPTPADLDGWQSTGIGRGGPSCGVARALAPSARVLLVGPGSPTRFRGRMKGRGERLIHPSLRPSSGRAGRIQQPRHRATNSRPRHRSRPHRRGQPIPRAVAFFAARHERPQPSTQDSPSIVPQRTESCSGTRVRCPGPGSTRPGRWSVTAFLVVRRTSSGTIRTLTTRTVALEPTPPRRKGNSGSNRPGSGRAVRRLRRQRAVDHGAAAGQRSTARREIYFGGRPFTPAE